MARYNLLSIDAGTEYAAPGEKNSKPEYRIKIRIRRIPAMYMWSIVLPLIRPKILFCLVMSTIGSIQVFEGAYMLTGVGPYFSNYTAIFHIYYQAFRYFRMGYASACAFILALLILFFTTVLFKFLGKHEEYY